MIAPLAIELHALLATLTTTPTAPPEPVAFHLIQIEQVIGGVNGDVTAQAVQLRMRAPFENIVSLARLFVLDAQGRNPVLLIDFMSNVPNFESGARVLVTSPSFDAQTTPTTVPDFPLTNLIPASYLTAGSLVFESDMGLIVWRLSWGGANYTGPNDGSIENDADGDYGPPFPGAPPTSCASALQFRGPAIAPHVSNATDYALTGNPAVFVNNAGTSFTVDVVGGTPDCPGTPYCFGVSCPCGNDDPPPVDGGCSNSTGSGAVLAGSGSTSVTLDDLLLTATGCPPQNSGLFFGGDTQLVPPVFVGDGLGCAGGNNYRYAAGMVSAGGVFTKTGVVATAPAGFITPGETRNFQAWTRDVLCGPPPAPCPSPCGNNSNLTNAYSVTFTP